MSIFRRCGTAARLALTGPALISGGVGNRSARCRCTYSPASRLEHGTGAILEDSNRGKHPWPRLQAVVGDEPRQLLQGRDKSWSSRRRGRRPSPRSSHTHEPSSYIVPPSGMAPTEVSPPGRYPRAHRHPQASHVGPPAQSAGLVVQTVRMPVHPYTARRRSRCSPSYPMGRFLWSPARSPSARPFGRVARTSPERGEPANERVFGAGSQLNRREAVAAVRDRHGPRPPSRAVAGPQPGGPAHLGLVSRPKRRPRC